MPEQTLRLFVSSPGDVPAERRRIDLVVERLNHEFAGRVRLETVRWELSYYSAHDTFQRQIPEAAECDVVVAIFRARLGTPLPASFKPLPSGEPYPSGTAYEVLSAMEVRRAGKRVPDVYVFRCPEAPSVELDAPDRSEIEAQWTRLKQFFDRWFRTQSGEFLAAFQTYTSTDDFAAKAEDCLRQWLARCGFRSTGPTWDRVLRGSPFPGLLAFDRDRDRVFFGRDAAIGQMLERIRETEQPGRLPFLLVIGASGSGKSSLLRAGLLPRLLLPGSIPEIDLWRPAILAANAQPFAALAEALFTEAALGPMLAAGTFRTPEILARQLAGDPDLALAPLRDALAGVAANRQVDAGFSEPRPTRLLLGIDQAERLFTEATPSDAAAFTALLAALARQSLATVVLILRSDAYPAFQADPGLVALREAGAMLDLRPPSPAELEEIVTRPVQACDPPLAFEQQGGHSLASRLVTDAEGGDALPLLGVTLQRLYAAEAARGDGALRFADYPGLDAAVTDTANEALATLDETARAELPALVAALVADIVTDPLTGAPLPVIAPLDRAAFATSPARTTLLDAFIAHRLLTAEAGAGRPLVRPVHESLLRIWPQATAILAETAALIRIRHTLAPLVRTWSEAADQAGYLELSPALLDGAQTLAARFGTDLPDDMRAFIAAAAAADAARRDRERQDAERRLADAQSLARANGRTARRTMAGLAAALVLAALAGWQWQEAGTARDRAQRTLTLATTTSNDLVFKLAERFENVVGIPAATVRDILDQARKLQDQLLATGQATPLLRASQAASLTKTTSTLLTLGDLQGAAAAGHQARSILDALVAQYPGDPNYLGLLAAAEGELAHVETASGDFAAALADTQASFDATAHLHALDPANPTTSYNLVVAGRDLGLALLDRNDPTAAEPRFRAALALAETLVHAPGDTHGPRIVAVLNGDLADLLFARGDANGAMANQQAALAIEQARAAANPTDAEAQHDLLVTHGRIGSLLAPRDKPAALASYEAELAIARRLAASDPGNTGWQYDLATTGRAIADLQHAMGDDPAAAASYAAAIGPVAHLVADHPGNPTWQRELSMLHNRAGDLHRAAGDMTAALADYQAGLAPARTLAAAQPADAQALRDLAFSLDRIGQTQAALKDYPAALATRLADRDIRARLAATNPGDPTLHRDWAATASMIGLLQSVTGDPQAALATDQAALPVWRQLAADTPGDPQPAQILALLTERSGDLQARLGHPADALASYRDAARQRDALAAAEPADAGRQRDRMVASGKLAAAQRAAGDLRAALAASRDNLDASTRLAAAAPADPAGQRNLSVAQNTVGDLLLALDDPAAALASYRSAFALIAPLAEATPANSLLQRDLAVTALRLGTALARQDDPEAAAPKLHQARDIVAALARQSPADQTLPATLSDIDRRLHALEKKP